MVVGTADERRRDTLPGTCGAGDNFGEPKGEQRRETSLAHSRSQCDSVWFGPILDRQLYLTTERYQASNVHTDATSLLVDPFHPSRQPVTAAGKEAMAAALPRT